MIRSSSSSRFPNDKRNQELLEQLKEIDESDEIECTKWECDFLESVLSQKFNLTSNQIETAERMFEKYL